MALRSVDQMPQPRGIDTYSQNSSTSSRDVALGGVSLFIAHLEDDLIVYSSLFAARKCAVEFVEFVVLHMMLFVHWADQQIAAKTKQ